MFKFLGNLILVVVVMGFIYFLVEDVTYKIYNNYYLYEIKEGKHHLTSKAGTVMEVSTMFKINKMGDVFYLQDGRWHVVLRETYN